MWASTLWPFSTSMRNIALGSGSTTRPSTSMAPSFLAMLVRNPRRSFRSRQCPDRRDIYPDFKREPVAGNSLGLGTQKVGADPAPLLHDTRSFAPAKIAPHRGQARFRRLPHGR